MRFAVMHVWPRVAELAEHRARDRRLEVGVVEDDERARCRRARARPASAAPSTARIRSFPTSVEPVNPSLRTSGFDVISAPIAGASSAAPVTTERTPAGRPASSASCCDRERRQRRLLGRLQHHRAAGGERRRRLARRHRRREVPGRDARGDADRLLEDEDAPVGARASGSCRRTPASPPRRTTRRTRRRTRSRARLGERLALLGHEEARESSSCSSIRSARRRRMLARSSRCATATPGSARSAASIARRVSAGAHARHLGDHLARWPD